MSVLKDSFGRKFPYIRLSISDVCNFKCGYCLPNGYQVDKNDTRNFLHLDEIKRLANCFSELGVNKIRITGCLLYTSPSPRDRQKSRMPSSA